MLFNVLGNNFAHKRNNEKIKIKAKCDIVYEL